MRIEEIQAEQVEKNASLRVPMKVPPLRIADRYAAGLTGGRRR